jgi:lysophospholipase L1-like esterase
MTLIVALLALTAAGELFARFALGLGDPPLSMSHPTIEYMFRPDRTYQRFGHTVKYNAYSMRSEDFPPTKASADELRVLMLGDSVINGGNLTDQRELASERLKRRLRQQLDRPVVVGNISAGSWGPGNLDAYIEQFGTFDADVAVLVLSSHDWTDRRSFKPRVGVNPSFPSESPTLALTEGFFRYLPRYLPEFSSDDSDAGDDGGDRGASSQLQSQVPAETTEAAIVSLIGRFQRRGIPVLLAQHASRAELTGDWQRGHDRIRAVAREQGATVVPLAPAYRAAIERGERLYRDGLHPNPAGQRVMAERLREALHAAGVVNDTRSGPGGENS